MDSLDTMLSDAVSISALLSYDSKFIKFRQLKKQMSNISTPSPSTSPEPATEVITLENGIIENNVLKTIDNIDKADDEERPLSRFPSETIGSEFFPVVSAVSAVSALTSGGETVSTASRPAPAPSTPHLTPLTPAGENSTTLNLSCYGENSKSTLQGCGVVLKLIAI